MATAIGPVAELSPARSPALLVPSEPPRPVGEGEESADAGGLSPAKLLHAVRRRWLIAIPLALAMAVAVFYGAESQLTPVYTARTMLHVSNAQPTLLYADLGGRTDHANYQRTQIATVKSRLVRQTVVRDLASLELATLRANPDPVAWLEKEIQADYTVAPEILRISLKGTNPDELLLVLNAIREAYMREILNKDHNERVARLGQLKELAAKHDTNVKLLRQKMAIKAEGLGARDVAALRVKYEQLTAQIHGLQTELLFYQAAIQRSEITTSSPDDPPADPTTVETALEPVFLNDLVADRIRKNIARIETRIVGLRSLKGYENDEEYKQLVMELAREQSALAKRREVLRGLVVDQVKATAKYRQTLETEALRRIAAGAKQYLPLLDAEIKRREGTAKELAGGIADLELLRSEMTQQEEQLRLVNSKIQALDVELQAPPRARVIEEAVIVETPRWDRPVKYAGAPAFGAFFVVLLFIAWLDVRRGRVDGTADIAAARIRVIGAVPTVQARVLPVFNPPEQAGARREYLRLTDAIDMARAVIAPVLMAEPGYTLVVASAAEGEGKTVLSGHLAVRFARSGRRTLLIDTDIRRPQIHRLFGLRRGPGFGELISGQATLAEVATPGPVPGLDVISAGNCDAWTVAELLDQRFPDVIQAVKLEYDVVIIDTAPLLTAPESLAFSRAGDGVVLSVMRDVSRLPGVLASYERLLSVNACVLGAIVTGDAPAQYASY
ncbi:MAG: AAA family ATPase [Planctomycetia bacterium]|nr:AAA family ATPase [Planctomycetia bacterium]